MPGIKDFFKRIGNSLFGRNNVPRLESARATVDLNLKASLNENSLNYFENPQNFNDYCRNFFSIPGNFENQYDYAELITMMQENGAMQEYQSYLEYIKNNPSLYYPSPVHGVDHTSRVTLFAEMLCMLDSHIVSEHEKNLIMVAAQLHDIGREDDGKNFDHGLASKYKIEQLGLLRNFSDRDREIIEFAVASHSLKREQVEAELKKMPKKDRDDFKKVLDYLQDADKLDRTRIANPGWGLDPNRLTSDTAKRLVKVAHQNYWEYGNMMSYQNKRVEQTKFENQVIPYFNEIRSRGFNISLEAFKNIVSEYKPGTLEMLYSQGKLESLFSYDTFQKYRKDESFDDRLNPNRINPDDLYSDITKRQQIILMRETFDEKFMLYYNLKKNNPEAYNLLCYVDIDITDSILAGTVEVVKIEDLQKLNQNGHSFRMNDLVYLATKVPPEVYTQIVESGQIEDLYSSKYCYNPNEINSVREQLQRKGISIDEQTFHSNFRLIQELVAGSSNILQQPGIEKYSLPEIFCAATKLRDAKFRIRDGKTADDLNYDSRTILDLVEFTRNTKVLQSLTEEEQLDVVEKLAKDANYVKDPRFINYVTKKNKPFKTDNPKEVLNYREYCADRILMNPNISLDAAKSILVNALFTIDVPPEHGAKFEQEMVDTLYYHQKYLPNSYLETSHKGAMDVMRALFDAKNITDFKNQLSQYKHFINAYNTDQIGYMVKDEISQFSRVDMVSELQDTARQIDAMPVMSVMTTSGRPVNAKVLAGQQFCLATSTIMPKCSGMSNKILKENAAEFDKYRQKVYEMMLTREQSQNEKCVSIVKDGMLAHASSSLPDQELIFAYVPQDKNNISIAAMYDLSTVKNQAGIRTSKLPTTPRSTSDFVAGTTEEHNEVVMNNVYPRYIVCYDKITDIAVKKRDALEQEYKAKGINQPVEILFVDGKGTYIPQIKNRVEQEHSDIRRKLENGTFSDRDFANMFERKESSFLLRTLQAIHSTSYRGDVWSDAYNHSVLESMTDILDRVSQIVPPEKARLVAKQVDTLIERSDTHHGKYGARFYDRSYAYSINTPKLTDISRRLESKYMPYERSQPIARGTIKQVDDAPSFEGP